MTSYPQLFFLQAMKLLPSILDSAPRLSAQFTLLRRCRRSVLFTMASDEIVWQIINQQFCSYKLK